MYSFKKNYYSLSHASLLLLCDNTPHLITVTVTVIVKVTVIETPLQAADCKGGGLCKGYEH